MRSTKDFAELYGVSERTIRSYRAKGAPLHNSTEMREWIARQRGRAGVSKYNPRIVPTAETIANGETADVFEDYPGIQPGIDSTIARLELAERKAFETYRRTGISRDGNLWCIIAEQLRKQKMSAARDFSEINEADYTFVGQCLEVIATLQMHLNALPKLAGILCEGLERDKIEAKLDDQIHRTLASAFNDLAVIIRGSKLADVLPLPNLDEEGA